MPILELTDAQVVDLLKQLPPERQREALVALAAGSARRRENRMQYAEDQLRRLSVARGLIWDEMSEDEREALVDDLMHEDRDDLEWYARERDPEFLASLVRAREQVARGETLGHEALKRELGLVEETGGA